MSSKATHIQPWGRRLFAVLLPLLLLLVWCLHDSRAYVQNTTPDGVGLFWSSSQATLNLRLGCPPNNRLTEYGPCWDDAARDAAQRWNAVGADFRFRLQSPSRSAPVACDSRAADGITTVVWADTHCGMAWDDTTLAVTGNWFTPAGALVDSDVFFNTTHSWSTYSGPQRFGAVDFHRVALHEFGHVLGLDHPDDHGQFVNAIMNSRADDTDRLQADDIAGIRAIYGSSSSQGQPGHADYCRDYGPCRAGVGDCDPGQCASGLVCVNDVGARYGLPAHYDVCEARGSGPDPDYCVSNYCGLGDGDCDPGQCDEGVCVNDVGTRYGLPAHYDVCEAGSRPDPDYCVSNDCGLGEGDCDPGQCDEGVCVNDVGARYGLPAHYDVCEAGSRPDPDYCVRNYCGLGAGDCDPGQCDEGVCVNDVGARYGLPAHYDVCEAGGGGGGGDDHGDTRQEATNISLPSDTPGSLEANGDTDYFRLSVPRSGTLTVETTGSTDTDGGLYTAAGSSLASDDDSGSGLNFRIVRQASAGTYYVKVGGYADNTTGSYTLRVRFTASGGGGGNSLNDLLGTWQFRYTIISTFTNTYRLSRIDTSTGTPLIIGTEQYGTPVVAGRIQDISPGNSLPYDFALLELSDFLICRFFVFDKIGTNRVEGLYVQIRVRNGQCSSAASDISNPYPMTGTRTSRATSGIQEQSTLQGTVVEQLNAELQSLRETTTLGLSSPNEADSAAIRDIINMLSSALN